MPQPTNSPAPSEVPTQGWSCSQVAAPLIHFIPPPCPDACGDGSGHTFPPDRDARLYATMRTQANRQTKCSQTPN